MVLETGWKMTTSTSGNWCRLHFPVAAFTTQIAWQQLSCHVQKGACTERTAPIHPTRQECESRQQGGWPQKMQRVLQGWRHRQRWPASSWESQGRGFDVWLAQLYKTSATNPWRLGIPTTRISNLQSEGSPMGEPTIWSQDAVRNSQKDP